MLEMLAQPSSCLSARSHENVSPCSFNLPFASFFFWGAITSHDLLYVWTKTWKYRMTYVVMKLGKNLTASLHLSCLVFLAGHVCEYHTWVNNLASWFLTVSLFRIHVGLSRKHRNTLMQILEECISCAAGHEKWTWKNAWCVLKNTHYRTLWN